MNALYAGLAALALLGALLFGVMKWESAIEQRGYDRANAEHAAQAVQAQAEARAEEQRRTKAQQEAQDAHDKELAAARADAAGARGDVARLQKRIAALNCGGGFNLPAAPSGTAADALGVVFSQCAERYSKLGEDADAARNAGLLCERRYDALIPPQTRAAYDRAANKVKGVTP